MNVNLTAFIDSLGVCIAHFLISFPQFISDVIKNVQQNHTGGANSKNICFGRTAKFIRESEDIAGNREPREIIRETANNIGILHIIKNWTRYIGFLPF